MVKGKRAFLSSLRCLGQRELNKEFIERECKIKIKKLLKLVINEREFGFDIYYE